MSTGSVRAANSTLSASTGMRISAQTGPRLLNVGQGCL